MDQSTLRRLALTPIGRRWVLKVGGASAVTVDGQFVVTHAGYYRVRAFGPYPPS